MANTKTYDVHRGMHGEGRDYVRGDTRDMTEIDAEPLVKLGALSLAGEDPAERAAAVRHTFGTETSAVNEAGYTVAGEPSVTLDRTNAAKPAAKKPTR